MKYELYFKNTNIARLSDCIQEVNNEIKYLLKYLILKLVPIEMKKHKAKYTQTRIFQLLMKLN